MTFHVIGIQVWSHEMRLNEIHNQKGFTGRWEPRLTSGFWQVGGVGVADYVERNPNREQLDEVVCKDDPRQGFSFVLNNFGLLLDDSFLQNLTERICEGRLNRVSAAKLGCFMSSRSDFKKALFTILCFFHRQEVSNLYLSK